MRIPLTPLAYFSIEIQQYIERTMHTGFFSYNMRWFVCVTVRKVEIQGIMTVSIRAIFMTFLRVPYIPSRPTTGMVDVKIMQRQFYNNSPSSLYQAISLLSLPPHVDKLLQIETSDGLAEVGNLNDKTRG